ncbi:MAG: hypothetical protein RR588_09945 [Solibacillus sp.]
MKWLHKLFSLAGLSLGGANACFKYGCKKYCGYSPSEAMRLHELEHPLSSLLLQKDCDDELPTHIEGSD